MVYMTSMDSISNLCSHLGRLAVCGDTEAVKILYGTVWMEHPALVRTISQLQDCLTSVEIEKYTDETYCPEFLYYWGMICLGEQSPLITKELETAEACFHKIEKHVSVVKARLAYIDLLQSDEPAKTDRNIARIEILRKCGAYQRDLFSSIVLSKIAFYRFLEKTQENSADSMDFMVSELPIRAVRLLEPSIKKGHPVAIRFWNDMLTCIDVPEAMSRRIDKSRICPSILYDFKLDTNVQTSGRKGEAMNTSTERPTNSPPVTVREYKIGGTKYIVRATIKDGASEDATAKIRRLIRNEISRTKENNG